MNLIIVLIGLCLCMCCCFISIFGGTSAYLVRSGTFVPKTLPPTFNFKTYPNKALVGPVSTLKEIPNRSLDECITLCDKDFRCLGGNYKNKDRECKLIQQTHETLGEKLEDMNWDNTTYFHRKKYDFRFKEPRGGWMTDKTRYDETHDNEDLLGCMFWCLDKSPLGTKECTGFNYNPVSKKCQILGNKPYRDRDLSDVNSDWVFYEKIV